MKDTLRKASAPPVKKPYKSPRLIKYGSVASRTAAKTGSNADAPLPKGGIG